MTFLQPFILFGLPLILLPVIIHLINRRRHRSQYWAAMRFLVSASRTSVSHAKLRQFLILLFRVLAVLMLILFLSRPLMGGWIGWAVSPAPESIVVLLDRSATMEDRIAGSTETKRERALTQIAEAAAPFSAKSHLVLIDSARLKPYELADAGELQDLPQVGPTDRAADIPAMLQTAMNWLVQNEVATAEIWLASDLQSSNWEPDDSRWEEIRSQWEAFSGRLHLRLLALNQGRPENRTLVLREATRRQGRSAETLEIVADIERDSADPETIPITTVLNEGATEEEARLVGGSFRWRHRESLPDDDAAGWGSLTLPADGNRRDNTAFFVYARAIPLHTTVVSDYPKQAFYLRLAAGAFASDPLEVTDWLRPDAITGTPWDESSLLVWQAPLPTGDTARRVRAFAEAGGVVLFLPPGDTDGERFAGYGWGDVEKREPESTALGLGDWRETGPLRRTQDGEELPIEEVEVRTRQHVLGGGEPLASFQDGRPFLIRHGMEQGEIYFCSSLPGPEWSTLHDGVVLVPLVQRLLQDGVRRLEDVESMTFRELNNVDLAREWEPMAPNESASIDLHAGVYRSGDKLVAVNRPERESEARYLRRKEAVSLFGDLSFQMLTDRSPEARPLQGEMWRVLLFIMLIFLVGEGALILPPRRETS